MRIFGCPAYALQKEDKLDLRTRKVVLLGYPERVERLQVVGFGDPNDVR